MTVRILPPIALVLAATTSSPAWATCTAEPSPAFRDLEWCLSQGDLDIVLKQGDHYAAKFHLQGGTTLRADPRATEKPLVRTSRPNFLEVLAAWFNNAETGYVTEEYPTFFVDTNAAPVKVEGLAFAPLTVEAPRVGAVTVGRVFQVHDASLTLTDCEMVPVDFFPGDLDPRASPLRVRDDLTEAGSPDRTGGLLARATGRSELRLEQVTVAGILAPEVEGAAVYASGADVKVEIVGGAYSDSIVGFGMVAASDGAAVYVLSEDRAAVTRFSGLRGQLGGAVYATEGGTVELYAGVYEDNGHVDASTATTRGIAGAHAAADRGGVLKIWDGEYFRGNAAFGGVAAVRNASLYVSGGDFGGTERSANTARAGGLFAIFRDPNVAGGTPFARLDGVELIGGRVARNRAEEDAYDGADDTAETPDDGRYGTAGGAILALGGTLELVDVVLDGNEAVEGLGGAVFGLGTDIEVVGGRLGNNLALGGAGIAVSGGSLRLEDVALVSNGYDAIRTVRGGGVLAVDASVTIENGTVFEGNFADTGGGLDVSGLVDVFIRDAQFVDNVAREGGAVRSRVRALSVLGGRLDGNYADGGGGAVAAFGGYDEDGTLAPSAVTLSEVVLGSNQATWGGAILAEEVELVVQTCGLVGNNAVEVGGAIATQGGSARIERDTDLRGNSAEGVGGAIYVEGAELVLDEAVLIGNEAPYASAVLVDGGPSTVTSNRICGNRATERGVVVLSANASDRTSFLHNLVDEPDTQDTVVSAGGSLDAGFNQFRHADTAAFTLLSGGAEFHHNVIAYGESAPLLARTSAGRLTLKDNVFWGLGQPADQIAVQVEVVGDFDWQTTQPLDLGTDGYVSADPRLRGWTDGRTPAAECAFEDHHPRPDSPLLTRYETGMAFDKADEHGGLWGGNDAALHPTDAWEVSLDGDAVPVLFDCDDRDLDVLDRVVQYVDADGDGVGGPEAGGYACRIEAGQVDVGGDCDDADARVQGDCTGDPVTFYGTRCSASGVESLGGLWLAALAVAFRRRRRGPAGRT